MELLHVNASEISAGNNDRKKFDPVKLEELAASIQQNGLAQPPTVVRWNGQYRLVAGERRVRAMRDVLGWETIPVYIQELTEKQQSAIMLAENTARENLNPIEEAMAYRVRLDDGWAIEEVAEAAGRTKYHVENRLCLLQLVPEVQQLIADKHFPIGHGEVMSELDNNRQRIAVRHMRTAASMPLRRFQEIVSQLLEQQMQQNMFDMDALMRQPAELPPPMAHFSGKKAKTGAPMSTDLPPVAYQADDAIADIMERYMASLMASGEEVAAQAVGNLYRTLVAHNWTSVANRIYFPASLSTPPVGDEVHEKKLKA